jgi:3-hydroxybutyryl-CoA dehydrogenase
MRVAVIGAGTMGSGIAQVCAVAGHEVVLRDVDESVLAEGRSRIESTVEGGVERGKLTEAEAEAALDRVRTTTRLSDASDADLVIEAVPEDMDLKRDVFADLERVREG